LACYWSQPRWPVGFKSIDKGREYLDRGDQQYAEQGQVDPQTQQQYWPQEQVAAQQQWNQNYGGQGQVYPPQTYQNQQYPPPTYQNQQYPAQQQQYPAPQYYPQQ
jgi:hypothetical protein